MGTRGRAVDWDSGVLPVEAPDSSCTKEPPSATGRIPFPCSQSLAYLLLRKLASTILLRWVVLDRHICAKACIDLSDLLRCICMYLLCTDPYVHVHWLPIRICKTITWLKAAHMFKKTKQKMFYRLAKQSFLTRAKLVFASILLFSLF